MTKKVLLIAYYFPPSGGAGVQRTLKFVKYLQEFGWQPVVLTVQNADYPAVDESLLAEIPQDTPVYRSKIAEPYAIYRRLTGQKNGPTDIAVLSRDPDQQLSLREKFSEWIRAAFFVPDARIGWLPFAASLGKKIIAREQIDLIYSSAPPYTAHLIAGRLHRRTGLPWVADFRDSWIGWLSAPQWRPLPSRAVEKWMERGVLRDATRVLAVSAGVREDLLSRHPHLRDGRWHILTNGYDSADSTGRPRPRATISPFCTPARSMDIAIRRRSSRPWRSSIARRRNWLSACGCASSVESHRFFSSASTPHPSAAFARSCPI